MTGQIIAAVVTLVLLTVAPGPDVAVVTRAALTSRAAAARAAFGITTGLMIWGVLTVAGLAALLAASATAYAVVKYVCAVYLLWLGVMILIRSRRAIGTEMVASGGMTRPWRTGFMSNILNPKIAVFYTGLLPQLVPDGVARTPGLVALVVFHVVITILWLLAYGAIVRRAADVLERPSAQRMLERITGVVLIGFGLRVATSSHR